LKKITFIIGIIILTCFIGNSQELEQIISENNEETVEKVQEIFVPESYSFIVNRRIYKLEAVIKDNIPYFSIDSIFYPLSSIGMGIEKKKNSYAFTYEEKLITFSPLKGQCIIPADPEPEKIENEPELNAEKKQELIELEKARQKEKLKFNVTSIIENKKVFVTSDFIINTLASMIKKQIGYDSNTGTFFIGDTAEIKINYGLKEKKDYSVLQMLCPAQIKYKITKNNNLMTISINSTFNIDKNEFLNIESSFFTIEDIYFQSSKTIIKILLSEKVHKTYDTFDKNFSTLKLYFYSQDYYKPTPVVNSTEIYKEKTFSVKTVIIDPGHGGDDIGAKGKKGVVEKDITLAIAFKLLNILKNKGYKVVMTRFSDIFVPLKERTGIANNNKGDIFISIHVNASVRKAYGAETYYLSLKGMNQVSDTVAFENREFPDKKTSKESKNNKNDLMFILWDMAQTEYLKDSAELAEEIQKSMNILTGIRDRGVKQASLVVLKGLNMPGVLVEVAFLSNPKEESRLTTNVFQQNTATAIADSIDNYKLKYEAKMKEATKNIDSSLTTDGEVE